MLGPMTREELQAAIEKPAEGQGATIEAGLVERLLDDVGQEPGNLPLLEFALTLLWEQLEEGCMTHAAYEGIGRVEGALARYAEEAYAELGAEEQAGARRVFVQLVQPGEETGDTRRVATRADLGEENFPPGPALGGPAAGGHRAGPHHRQRAGGGGARSADPALGTAADLDGRGPPLSDVAGAATGRAARVGGERGRGGDTAQGQPVAGSPTVAGRARQRAERGGKGLHRNQRDPEGAAATAGPAGPASSASTAWSTMTA